jgi:hypothetical protein
MKGSTVVGGLRCGTIRVNRHPADDVFFRRLDGLVQVVAHVDGLDSVARFTSQLTYFSLRRELM